VAQGRERNEEPVLGPQERKIQKIFGDVVDQVDVKSGTVKLFKDGKRVSKLALSSAAKVRKQVVTDYLRKVYAN